MRASITTTLIVLISTSNFAQAAEPLTLNKIMADPDWIGRAPENPIWAHDGSQIFFQRKRAGTPQRDWWKAGGKTAKPKRLTLEQTTTGDVSKSVYDQNRTRRVFSMDGDLFVQELASGKIRQLTRTQAKETSARFLDDGSRLRFERKGEIFVRNLESGLESQPAVVLFEKAPSGPEPPKGFLAEKERELFRYLQQQAKDKAAAKANQKKFEEANEFDVPPPYYLGAEYELSRQEMSNDARWLAVVKVSKDSKKKGRSDAMPVWVKDDAYTESRVVRSLVGTVKEGDESLTLLDLESHKTIPINLSKLPGISDDPLAALRQGESDGKSTPRHINIRYLRFSANSKQLLFQAYSIDNKDRWICLLNIAGNKPKLQTLHHRRDPAWINWRANVAGWVTNAERLFFVSEASGYAHLYTAAPATDSDDWNVRRETRGKFEVSSVKPSHRGDRIFYRSNATHPGVYELSVLDLKNGQSRQLSKLGGMNEFVISPDETSAAVIHSTLREPPELFRIKFADSPIPKAGAEKLTSFTTKQFRDIHWTVPQIVKVPTRSGHQVYTRLYLPKTTAGSTTNAKTAKAKDKSAGKKRPAVVFVHGAGYLQNAHKGWSGYFREFMFHTLLTQRGYVVIDMDYRASAGYGRDWRTAIYRQMGTPELEDLKDGVNWLVREHQVDRQRVGVYGGSYGGFMTLMALFKAPDLFACGAALRPVTDWAHYNHGYTSNILNTPEVDPASYESSSPIYFAEGLEKPLLMCHGMLDDNVFFKDTVRLTQKLIELEKEDWQVAMYPIEPHGFRQPSSWLDEYRRVLKMFESHLAAGKE